MIIAIDGPSSVGKSTISRAVARELGFMHVDSGAVYRVIALAAVDAGIVLADAVALTEIIQRLDFRLESGRVLLNEVDVTSRIRTPAIDLGSATVARVPTIRSWVVDWLRKCVGIGSAVVEGRDIGTVVFPEAAVKVYLDASVEERAKRRAGDSRHAALRELGVDGLQTALADRDRLDTTRSVAPLRPASDAIRVDTTAQSTADVISHVLKVVQDRLGSK